MMTTSETLARGDSIGIGVKLSNPDEPAFPSKVFASPFRVVFKKVETQDYVWIEVETLEGLKSVAKRVATADLVPINAFSTLDRQLWGHLAEYCGFLRQKNDGELGAGIQPIGKEQSQLADDMVELFGGTEPALQALSDMRQKIVEDLESRAVGLSLSEQARQPGNPNTVIKPDGVNLTSEGEEALEQIIYGSTSDLHQEQDNAEVIAQRTTDAGTVGDEIVELDAQLKEDSGNLVEITGEEAAEIGRRVEEVGNGELTEDSTE